MTETTVAPSVTTLGQINSSQAELFNNSLPFEAKLEQELSSAPKGLILIVKEPGESNLIAGEQVDGNLNPISVNGTTVARAEKLDNNRRAFFMEKIIIFSHIAAKKLLFTTKTNHLFYIAALMR